MAPYCIDRIAFRYFQAKGYCVDEDVVFPMSQGAAPKRADSECIDMVAYRLGELAVIRCEPSTHTTWGNGTASHTLDWFRHAVRFIVSSPYSSRVPAGGIRKVIVADSAPDVPGRAALAASGVEVLLLSDVIREIFQLVEIERRGYAFKAPSPLTAEDDDDVVLGLVRKLVAMDVRPGR